MSTNILEMKSITKTFPGVKALIDVNLEVEKGHIHALVGENGAGKSTLMNVLSGIYPHGSYEGDILYQNKVCRFKNIKDSERQGIAIIHQELALNPFMSIAENIFLGNERQKYGVINWHETNDKAVKLMQQVGLKLEHTTLVRDIGVGHQQLTEIAKALAKDCQLLILDEPTAALNDEDSANLIKLLVDLNKNHGITCIIISHKLHELTEISNKITVLRDGMTIQTLVKGRDVISESIIIKSMVGRELVDRFPKRTPHVGEIGFEVKNWTVYDPMDEDRKIIDNVSLNVRKGEIVGISGLMGAGRTEFAMSVFGRAYGRKISGTLIKDGQERSFHNVNDAIEGGVVYLTEDRKGAGLILIDDIRRNISLSRLTKISNRGVIDSNKEIDVANEYRDKLRIKSSGIFQKAGTLSGGNQQKVCVAKGLFAEPDVLLLDEPTRGIDVGSKYEIYSIINQLAEEGKCVLFISSELPEILGICDRIYVMNEGRIVGNMTKEEASPEKIMTCIIQSAAGRKN
jgi:putative multiple sugar transport system ATP-binding protein